MAKDEKEIQELLSNYSKLTLSDKYLSRMLIICLNSMAKVREEVEQEMLHDSGISVKVTKTEIIPTVYKIIDNVVYVNFSNGGFIDE